ncbi:MAG: PilN domain-containing protein [Patescibacteria group bacterium]
MPSNYINLLPKEDQKEVVLEKINSKVLNFFLWIFVSLAIIAALFVAARFYLKFELQTTTDQIALQQQVVSKEENQKLKNQLVEFNNHLSNLIILSEHHALWSEIVTEFARLVPVEVAVDSFVADRKTGNIKISGFAKNREAILLLRKNLLSSEYFLDVNFPLSNLTRPTDANFNYSFYINPKYLFIETKAKD